MLHGFNKKGKKSFGMNSTQFNSLCALQRNMQPTPLQRATQHATVALATCSISCHGRVRLRGCAQASTAKFRRRRSSGSGRSSKSRTSRSGTCGASCGRHAANGQRANDNARHAADNVAACQHRRRAPSERDDAQQRSVQPLTRGSGKTWGIGTGWQVRKSDKSNSALELMLCEFVEALTRVSKAQYDKLTGVAAGATAVHFAHAHGR